MATTLSAWPAYVESRQAKKIPTKLATFHARYNFAANFQSITVKHMTTKTQEVYAAITKIGFAYSALEHIEHSLGIQDKPAIYARDLAEKARILMPRGSAGFSNKMDINHSLKLRLDTVFSDNSSSDVRAVVELFRHSLFHGKFTPTGWGLRGGSEGLEMLQGLAQVTLRSADETFTTWFIRQDGKLLL
jgi:hypothetical protein